MESTYLVPIFSILGFFATTFGILYLYFTTRHKERIALIERGLEASIFKSTRDSTQSLQTGMVAVGFALGLLLGEWIKLSITSISKEAVSFSMVFLMSGLALIAYYIIRKKIDKEDN